jgi:hypothetical protein
LRSVQYKGFFRVDYFKVSEQIGIHFSAGLAKKEAIEDHLSKMLFSLKGKDKNKTLWWNNRSIFLYAKK